MPTFCWTISSSSRRASRITSRLVIYHVPAPGDQVPDFKLRNQDGRDDPSQPVPRQGRCSSLSSTRAARCPTSARWSRATLPRSISNCSADPALYAKTHLLCVSFDPEHDTPERLRAYGATYIGSDAKSAFAHWDFAGAG